MTEALQRLPAAPRACATLTERACFQRNAEAVASHRCEVVEHRWVNDRYKYLTLSAPADLAGATRPGHFSW